MLRVDRRMRLSYAPFRLRLIFITSFNSSLCLLSCFSLSLSRSSYVFSSPFAMRAFSFHPSPLKYHRFSLSLPLSSSDSLLRFVLLSGLFRSRGLKKKRNREKEIDDRRNSGIDRERRRWGMKAKNLDELKRTRAAKGVTRRAIVVSARIEYVTYSRPLRQNFSLQRYLSFTRAH